LEDAMTKILIIDDSLMIRQQVSRVLASAGFEMLEARDGQDALDALDASPDTRLVFCDVNMPVMNGLEFLERLKAAGRPTAVPVVMLTTEGQPELIQRAKSLGARGWIVKPFKPEMLLATARKFAAAA
jgi:two-component system chemotaxis response regulator CheY